jgi:uncharacterized protein
VLNSWIKTQMPFTAAEKLQIAMLCDIAKPADQRELDFRFINSVVSGDQIWSLDCKYPGLQLGIETPQIVSMVADILEMWNHIESSFGSLNETDKKRVESDSSYKGKPEFPGFDGNYEAGLRTIATILIHDLERWQRFNKRNLNWHWPIVDVYERELAVWRPIWSAKIENSEPPYELTADELIAILREGIHPENRKPTTGDN